MQCGHSEEFIMGCGDAMYCGVCWKETLEAALKAGSASIKTIVDKIDEAISKAPLETDHGHHVDDNGWLKGKLDD